MLFNKTKQNNIGFSLWKYIKNWSIPTILLNIIFFHWKWQNEDHLRFIFFLWKFSNLEYSRNNFSFKIWKTTDFYQGTYNKVNLFLGFWVETWWSKTAKNMHVYGCKASNLRYFWENFLKNRSKKRNICNPWRVGEGAWCLPDSKNFFQRNYCFKKKTSLYAIVFIFEFWLWPDLNC